MQVTKIDRAELREGMTVLMVTQPSRLMECTVQLARVQNNQLVVHGPKYGYPLALAYVKANSQSGFYLVENAAK